MAAADEKKPSGIADIREKRICYKLLRAYGNQDLRWNIRESLWQPVGKWHPSRKDRGKDGQGDPSVFRGG
jgi:hypothetical protein